MTSHDDSVSQSEEFPETFVDWATGSVTLQMRNNIRVEVGLNSAVSILNKDKKIHISLSNCGTEMALTHPQGRVLQYNSRVEIHTRNGIDKSAKIWPKGISFTSSNCALIYLVDSAGTRSTTDFFHDLFAEDIADSKW